MKKLKLKAVELGATELLTREELKNVLGGIGGGSGEECTNNCGVGLDPCPEGESCYGEPCPNDEEFYHNVCKAGS